MRQLAILTTLVLVAACSDRQLSSDDAGAGGTGGGTMQTGVAGTVGGDGVGGSTVQTGEAGSTGASGTSGATETGTAGTNGAAGRIGAAGANGAGGAGGGSTAAGVGGGAVSAGGAGGAGGGSTAVGGRGGQGGFGVGGVTGTGAVGGATQGIGGAGGGTAAGGRGGASNLGGSGGYGAYGGATQTGTGGYGAYGGATQTGTGGSWTGVGGGGPPPGLPSDVAAQCDAPGGNPITFQNRADAQAHFVGRWILCRRPGLGWATQQTDQGGIEIGADMSWQLLDWVGGTLTSAQGTDSSGTWRFQPPMGLDYAPATSAILFFGLDYSFVYVTVLDSPRKMLWDNGSVYLLAP